MSRQIAIPVYGLIYYYQQRFISLPLLAVRAEASIKELAAQVKLIQTFGNDATFPIEAKYSFPIPARASICSFVMIKQDGTRVAGLVQEKQAARETYNTAVAQGQQASLMEEQTADVFEVSVGNIPPNEEVQIELVYATELSEDEENDSIRFHLPVHIGSRYGQGPQTTPSTFRRTAFISSSSPTPFLNVSISVEAIAPIAKIGSPSHTVSTELGPDPKLPNFKELPFSNYARVSLSSDSALEKDFVLTVKSAGLDTPRCVAELHPTNDTVALGLTLVPRFKLPEVSRQEFVFMVDRSGSMGGKRIEAAKKALVVMLRALPHQDSLFQIVSFGTRTTSLWPNGSKSYNQETLEAATHHVDSMRADFGGTEIRAALQHCFKARKLDRPMSLLVLTDGDAWDLDGVFAEVKSAVAEAPQKAYLRVSVLGIGNSASTAMCEGMARVGNGTCMMVGEEETSFTGKIARMLKAAKAPPISNISVDWGRPLGVQATKEKEISQQNDEDDFELVEGSGEKKQEKKTLNIFDEDIEDPIVDSTPAPPPPPVVLPPPAAVQQAPFKIRNLFPNIRLNVYAILQGKTIPQTVIIRGSTADGAEIDLPIPVVLSHLGNVSDAPPAIHALAARKIIQDLEDGQHEVAKTLAKPDDTDLLERTVKACIVRLGTTYSIASTHTSFVAVDHTRPGVPPAPPLYFVHYNVHPHPHIRPSPSYAQPRHRSSMAVGHAYAVPPPAPSAPLVAASFSDSKKRVVSTHPPGSFGATPRAAAPSGASGFGKSMSISSAVPARRLAAQQVEQSSAVRSKAAAAPSPALYLMSSPSSTSRSTASASKASRSPSSTSKAPPPPNVTDSDILETLARLQSFDGCFSLEVLSVIKLKSGIEDVRKAFPDGATDGVVTTVLAMAFLSTKLGGVDRDSWEGIYEKAQQYVEMALQNMGVTQSVDVLEAKIAGLLA
ncbi:von Willebrand factor type A domain-containing protein [Mycena alexandri]|uniref:von Willebrand factor type A domain-containing protein n=1 Tax=Mycena alexandri TaxID=1745969 RepID=A0AAD6T7Z0_9AGAR|nr:von Willebrand factor type A domain-containing protein [Mycena alexandri]